MEATCGGLHLPQPSSSAHSVPPPHIGRQTEDNAWAISKMPIKKINIISRGRACAIAMAALGAALSPITTVSAQDAAKIEAGENVFATNCAICHGDQLESTGQTFDLRRLKDNERARFDNSVRNGKNQMPPWKGKLSDEEIDQLWHYIRANAYQK
jgi:mono/diheme cytochrome c family protein